MSGFKCDGRRIGKGEPVNTLLNEIRKKGSRLFSYMFVCVSIAPVPPISIIDNAVHSAPITSTASFALGTHCVCGIAIDVTQ